MITIKKISEQEMRKNPFGRDRRVDNMTLLPVKDNFFHEFELTAIKKTLYETKTEEFIGAQIWSQSNEYPAGAREVGYDILEPVGDARVGSEGAGANDIPFVSEKLEEITQRAVELEIGIKYTRNDIEAIEAVNAIGRGASISLPSQRAAIARKHISRTFDQGIFQGFAKYGMLGLQSIIPNARQTSLPTDNNTVYYEKVPDTGTGVGEAKRLWANKTALQIIDDLLRAKYEAVGKANIFNGDCLIVDTAAYKQLARPYSELNSQTILSYLRSEGMFSNIYQTNAVAKVNNGRNNTYFVVCDSSPEIAEIPILRALTVYPSQELWNGQINQLVALRYAGLMIRYKAGFYFGDGHIEAAV
jgi:hypothetical protein